MQTTDSFPALFASVGAYRSGFEAGLRRMLEAPTLGAFILVLANASYEAAMYARFRVELETVFDRWCAAFDAGDPSAIEAAVDDREVFERLRTTGLENLGTTLAREVGPWQCQFNPLRAFRPPRMSDAVIEGLHRPFDPGVFHFDKPFLRPEVCWEGEFAGQLVRLLYNKFPFADLHGLLVPDPGDGRAQYLDEGMLSLVWGLATDLGDRLPGLGFGYNAYGAYASVNHLHFQQFVRANGRYPIEADRWIHNGGSARYPLPVRVFDDCAQAWRGIAQLQDGDRAFNLLLRPSRIYVAERAIQGSYAHNPWTGGFAWAEIAGAVTLFDREAFDTIDEATLDAEFARLAG